jgi:hypothetical protein
MSITTKGNNLIVLTAATDAITERIPVQKIYVVRNGTDGAAELMDVAAGTTLAHDPTGAGTDRITELLGLRGANLPSLYVNTLPSAAEIHLYHR